MLKSISLFLLILPLSTWPQSYQVEVVTHSLWVRSQPSGRSSKTTNVSLGGTRLCVAPATSKNSAPPKPMSVPDPKSAGNTTKQPSNTLPLFTFLGVIGVVILSWKAVSLRRRKAKEMKTLCDLFQNPRFPANKNEAVLLLVLVKEAAIERERNDKNEDVKKYQLMQYLFRGLIPVLGELHHHLVKDLHRDARRSLKLMLGIGRAVLNELSEKGD